MVLPSSQCKYTVDHDKSQGKSSGKTKKVDRIVVSSRAVHRRIAVNGGSPVRQSELPVPERPDEKTPVDVSDLEREQEDESVVYSRRSPRRRGALERELQEAKETNPESFRLP